MRTHRFQLGDELLEVTASMLADGRSSVRVVRVRAGVRSERVLELDARAIGADHWLAIDGDAGAVHDVRVEREAGGGPGRVARFGGEHAAMDWIDPFTTSTTGVAAAKSGPRKVSSPMPGRVVSIPVAVGDSVEAGQAVIVVEAMKMANELRSPIAGRIKSIAAQPGDKVEAGVALVIVEPA